MRGDDSALSLCAIHLNDTWTQRPVSMASAISIVDIDVSDVTQ